MAVAAVGHAAPPVDVTPTAARVVASSVGSPAWAFRGPADLHAAHGALHPVAALAFGHEDAALWTLHRLPGAKHLLRE